MMAVADRNAKWGHYDKTRLNHRSSSFSTALHRSQTVA